jgi:hypothetical protein
MSDRNDMTCAELADVAAELALGVLTGRERALAVAHLEKCDACREHVRQLMATSEQLLELLPPAEPPAGFETRVLERLGLPAPAQEDAYPRLISRHEDSQRRRGPARSGTRPGTGQPGAPPARPGETRRPGRIRRVLAAAVIGLAVIAAGLGGWRVGADASPSPAASPAAGSAAGSLTSVSLLSATHQSVGNVFLYSGTSRWMYMSVDLDAPPNGTVTCQLVSADGKVTNLGSFRLSGGYGAWGGPDPGYVGNLSGARLVSANGTVLATATFTHW